MRFLSTIALLLFAVLFVQGVPANNGWEVNDSQEQSAVYVAGTIALSPSSTQETPSLLSQKRQNHQTDDLGLKWAPIASGYPLSSLHGILRC